MKATKPNKKDFTKPFIFDNNLVVFKAKEYLKVLEPYCNKLEQINKELLEALQDIIHLKGSKVAHLALNSAVILAEKAINKAL